MKIKYSMINEEVMPWRRVRCYESKINPLEDEVEPNLPDESRDQHLLKLFIDIINYSLTPSGKRRCSSSSSKSNIYFFGVDHFGIISKLSYKFS